MKYLPFILLFLSCTAEPTSDNKIIAPIPNGMMNQKESDMTDIIMNYKEFETSILLYNQAKAKANQMANDNILSHSGYFEDAINSTATYYGQCISYNYISAQSNVQAFYNSPEHWNTIINPNYDKIAVACEGKYTVVIVASWRTYNGKKALEIKEVRTGNVSTMTIH